jgi:arylsulfatase A-like enzyme
MGEKMKRRWICAALALCCAVAGGRFETEIAWAAPAEAAAAQKPNIIVILADDLGYADISAYGIHRIDTPNIDSIGNEGIMFTDGYASAPVCAPSRAGLQTGRYQDRFGFEFNNGPALRDLVQGLGLAVGEITIADQLRKNGYHTGAIGKWHMGSQDQFYPTNRGYDEFVGFLPGETAYIDPSLPGVHFWNPRGAADADATGERPRRHTRGPLSQVVEGPNRTVVHNEQQYLTEYWADRAVEYIHRNSGHDRPYFLYLAPNATHAPFMVTDKYYNRFPQIKDEGMRTYAGMISALDDAVGRVLKAVDDSGQANNTLIFFMTDNGCAGYIPGICSCQPLRGGKLTHYEGGVRVPFMVRWPAKFKTHQVDHRVVSLLDVFPTSVAAAGGTMPKDRVYDGVNLIPYLTGDQSGTPHDELMWRRTPLVSIRKGDWKLWESTGTEYGNYTLLFNLKSDLNESTNVAPKCPDKVKELEGDIKQWAKDLKDPSWPSRPAVTFDVCGTPFTLPI